MNYDCSGPRFDKLKNPYTGEPLHPKMSVSPSGRILFFAPESYTPAQSFPTAREAFRKWNRVNGVEGLKDHQPIVCAYTGKPLRLVHDGDGYHYSGGLDTRMLVDRPTFLYFASMRDGKSEYPEPAAETRVDKPAVKGKTADCAASRHIEEHKAEVTEESVRTAESIMQKHRDILQKPTVVSMAGGKGRKNK